MKRALISVSDKQGLIPFAKKLRAEGVDIISTGGTLALLKKNKIAARSVSELTGFPEILDGRVKTLHPMIHGGLLFKRNEKSHQDQIAELNIEPIDLVVVNLYPFTDAIQKKNATLETALENIDIGGPTMLRAAAKNFHHVAVVCNPIDYDAIISFLKEKGGIPVSFLRELAIKVFSLTSYYDSAIQGYLSESSQELPSHFMCGYEQVLPLRYGENPHQKAAFYRKAGSRLEIKQLHGKEISYNNIMDLFAAVEIINEFSLPAAAVIKHTNPCGVAENKSLTKAIERAIASDPSSAFGGIVVLNRPVGKNEAQLVLDRLAFFEVIIAPQFLPGAVKKLQVRKNLRIIETAELIKAMEKEKMMYRFVDGGLLVQEKDPVIKWTLADMKKRMRVASKRKPSTKDMVELLFAWRCAKMVKSNAIVLTRQRATVGIGAGQMSRVDAMHIACRKAGERSIAAYVASDGFFPNPDNIDVASAAGVKAIIQPGGSIRDREVMDAVNRHNLIMVLTGERHFRH